MNKAQVFILCFIVLLLSFLGMIIYTVNEEGKRMDAMVGQTVVVKGDTLEIICYDYFGWNYCVLSNNTKLPVDSVGKYIVVKHKYSFK